MSKRLQKPVVKNEPGIFMLAERVSAGTVSSKNRTGTWEITPLTAEIPKGAGEFATGANVIEGTKEDLKNHINSCISNLLRGGEDDGIEVDQEGLELEIWQVVGTVTLKNTVAVNISLPEEEEYSPPGYLHPFLRSMAGANQTLRRNLIVKGKITKDESEDE